jgi:CBS domain-containing protein
MTVAAILKQKGSHVVTVAPDAVVASVVATMRAHRIGAVPVIDATEELVGIVGERDVVACLAEHGAGALAMTAARIMTQAPPVVSLDTSVIQAMARMTETRRRHLPVMAGGHLVGLISIGDVVKARLTAQETEVNSLRAYVAGSG